MRLILILWIIPLVVFWGWYGLSANDISMGSVFFTRGFHDHMFRLYGQMLGVPPQEVPALIAGTFAFDTMLILAMAAFRWRKSWYPQTKQWVMETLNMAPEQVEDVWTEEDTHFSIEETFASTPSLSHSGETGRSTYPMRLAE